MGIAYIDYAHSLSFGWGDGPAPSVSAIVPPFPPAVTPDNDVIAETIGAIEAFTDQQIREVVDRMPESFLPSARRAVINEGLRRRREELRAAFRAQYGGTI